MANSAIEVEGQRPRPTNHSNSAPDHAVNDLTEAERGATIVQSLIEGHSPAAGRSNTHARASYLHAAQQTYGNRAVQRLMSRQVSISQPERDELAERTEAKSDALAVQRYKPPKVEGGDEAWFKHTLRSGGGAALGLAGTVPGIGNALSAFAAGAHGVAGLGSLAVGNDKQATEHWHGFQNNALNAIPLLGNVRSFMQGTHDAGVFYDDITGADTTPRNTSGQIYHNDQAPKVDAVLADYFRQYYPSHGM